MTTPTGENDFLWGVFQFQFLRVSLLLTCAGRAVGWKWGARDELLRAGPQDSFGRNATHPQVSTPQHTSAMALPLCMDGALHARIHYIADGAAPSAPPHAKMDVDDAPPRI